MCGGDWILGGIVHAAKAWAQVLARLVAAAGRARLRTRDRLLRNPRGRGAWLRVLLCGLLVAGPLLTYAVNDSGSRPGLKSPGHPSSVHCVGFRGPTSRPAQKGDRRAPPVALLCLGPLPQTQGAPVRSPCVQHSQS